MQGRLLPPINGQLQAFPINYWQRGLEFEKAQRLGLDCIEWIYGVESYNNPLLTKYGKSQIVDIQRLYGVNVRSLCADYFVNCPLLRG